VQRAADLGSLDGLVVVDFVRIPHEVWRQDVSGRRAAQFRTATFEAIVRQLEREAVVEHLWSESRENGSGRRGCATFVASAAAIDLFHSAPAGYRAQYFQSEAHGEAANAAALSVLAQALDRTIPHAKSNWLRRWAAVSFSASHAKVWIHQGLWIRHRTLSDRCLSVSRWATEQQAIGSRERKLCLWASLCPTRETRLVVKGGYLLPDGRPGGDSKPGRSRELHRYGFT
jgi:hypothetical protein